MEVVRTNHHLLILRIQRDNRQNSRRNHAHKQRQGQDEGVHSLKSLHIFHLM